MDKVNPSSRATDVKAFYALNEDGTVTIYTSRPLFQAGVNTSEVIISWEQLAPVPWELYKIVLELGYTSNMIKHFVELRVPVCLPVHKSGNVDFFM